MAQALYNYDPRADSPNPNPDLELYFKEGQIITVYGDKVSLHTKTVHIHLLSYLPDGRWVLPRTTG